MGVPLAVYELGEYPVPVELIRRASAEFPPWDWGGWEADYDSPLEKKRACAAADRIPPACWEALGRMALLPVGAGLVPDLSLWGGGLHAMTAGGFLGTHLDADVSPRLKLERRVNAVLFLDAWEAHWGGEFQLWLQDRSGVLRSVAPDFGRLVVFGTGDHTPHGVAELTCPPGVVRRTLALFWYGPPRPGSGKRRRALFLPAAGENDARKDALREERCR